jgi:nitrate/nitrite-specific signal transduction histidine kinase
MRERASQIHADLHLASQPGQGTTVRLDLPLPPSNGAPPAPEPATTSKLE